MSRCELHNITQVTNITQPQSNKDEVEKTVPNDTNKVSIQTILKDLRYTLKYTYVHIGKCIGYKG